MISVPVISFFVPGSLLVHDVFVEVEFELPGVSSQMVNLKMTLHSPECFGGMTKWCMEKGWKM